MTVILELFVAPDSPSPGTLDTNRTAELTIADNDHSPIAVRDNLTTGEDVVLVIPPTLLLANDSDVDELEVLSIVEFDAESVLGGSIELDLDGNLLYIPPVNTHGSDSFGYRIQDRTGNRAAGLVDIAITPVNDLPSISGFRDEVLEPGESVELALVLDDLETAEEDLDLSLLIEDPGLVPFAEVTGSGRNRNLRLEAASAGRGETQVRLRVEDGDGSFMEETLTITVTSRRLRVLADPTVPGRRVDVAVLFRPEGDEQRLRFDLAFDPEALAEPILSLGADAEGGLLTLDESRFSDGLIGVEIVFPAPIGVGLGLALGDSDELEVLTASFDVPEDFDGRATLLRVVGELAPLEFEDGNEDLLSSRVQDLELEVYQGIEADIVPRPDGDGQVDLLDVIALTRLAAALEGPYSGAEFTRGDCAIIEVDGVDEAGDGVIDFTDVVQGGRYAAGLDPQRQIGGPVRPSDILSPAVSRRGALIAQFGDRSETVMPSRIVVGKAVVGASGMVDVVVAIDSPGDLNTVAFSIGFDASLLSFEDAITLEGAKGASLVVNAKQASTGQLGLAFVGAAGTVFEQGLHDFVLLKFRVMDALLEQTAVTVGQSPIQCRQSVSVPRSSRFSVKMAWFRLR